MLAPVMRHQSAEDGFLDFLPGGAQALPFEYRQIAVDAVISSMAAFAKRNAKILPNVHLVMLSSGPNTVMDLRW